MSDQAWVARREDRIVWPAIKEALRRKFREKTRKEWEDFFDGSDACATPVFTHSELEASGYQQRAGVTLTGTPAVPMVGRTGWDVETLDLGEGSEQVLSKWMGWRMGRDYEVVDGGLQTKDACRL